jgi:hypothetical protein
LPLRLFFKTSRQAASNCSTPGDTELEQRFEAALGGDHHKQNRAAALLEKDCLAARGACCAARRNDRMEYRYLSSAAQLYGRGPACGAL